MSVLWAAFFFQGMALGCWLPALTNTLGALGLSDWVRPAFMVPPICALISPLIGGALADQRFSAERIYLWLSLAAAILIAAAFATLDLGWHPAWFLALLAAHALISGPTWAMLTSIALNGLENPERKFPLARLGGTIGWIAGGLVVSLVLHADSSPVAGYASGATRLVAVGLACLLPHTPPLGVVRDWRSRLGFDALRLLKQRDHLVFFLVTGLFSIPISAFYMYGPEFLRFLGDPHPTGTMTVGQVLEIVTMLVLGSLLARYSVKCVLLWALALSVLRFAMSAQAGVSEQIWWHIGGLALHGVCYTLYFITSQVFLDRRVDSGLRTQAQGLLMVVSAGFGSLTGTWLCGTMRKHMVNASGEGWVEFWATLSGMIAICTLIFAIFYKGIGSPRNQP
ncbi:MAG: MFS transporter [Akkermansiaceae bacterium]|nr:MFS transporter [Akkermansiaceae bacterium]